MYDANFKIIIFGDAGTGKEDLTQRFLTNLFVSDSKMTIGVDFEVKSLIVDGNKVKLQIWDFGGEERYRFLIPTYVRGAKGAMFTYDITNYSSLAHIDDWLAVVREELKPEEHFPILVVGLNADLSQYREVPAEDAIKIAKSRGVDGFIECSAKTGENVEKAFEALTRLMLDAASAYGPKEEKAKALEIIKKEYPIVIEEILLFMYNRQGRYKGQTTYTYLEGKIINYPEEEVKKGFDWLKLHKKYVDEISIYSIKINTDGVNLLKNLSRIPDLKQIEGSDIISSETEDEDINKRVFNKKLIETSKKLKTEKKKGKSEELVPKGKDLPKRAEYKETSLSPSIPETIDDLLKKLLGAIPKVEVATLVTTEGLPITSKLPKGVDEKRFAALVAALFLLSQKAMNEMDKGEYDRLSIKGMSGNLVILPAGPDAILALSTSQEMRPDFYFLGELTPFLQHPPEGPGSAGASGLVIPDRVNE